jgi:hypothetical protein
MRKPTPTKMVGVIYFLRNRRKVYVSTIVITKPHLLASFFFLTRIYTQAFLIFPRPIYKCDFLTKLLLAPGEGNGKEVIELLHKYPTPIGTYIP